MANKVDRDYWLDERKVIFTGNEQSCEMDGFTRDTTISLWENKHDNLILIQDGDQVVLSWDEFQELAEFYREEMDRLELKYG